MNAAFAGAVCGSRRANGRWGPPARNPQDDRERVVLAFTEQYVLDAHGVTDELCAEMNAWLSPPELAALTTAIATFEALARSRAALKGVIP